jgi:hypothetical protein
LGLPAATHSPLRMFDKYRWDNRVTDSVPGERMDCFDDGGPSDIFAGLFGGLEIPCASVSVDPSGWNTVVVSIESRSRACVSQTHSSPTSGAGFIP